MWLEWNEKESIIDKSRKLAEDQTVRPFEPFKALNFILKRKPQRILPQGCYDLT